MSALDLKQAIRDIADYPEPGVIFKDITPLLADPDLFNEAIDLFEHYYAQAGVTKILCAEARGFIIGAPLALRLHAGFVPARKPGKLPGEVYTVEYDLEYGTDKLEVHREALTADDTVLIVDDVLATGGTACAMIEMCKEHNAKIAGFACLLDLTFLGGAQLLKETCGVTPFALVS